MQKKPIKKVKKSPAKNAKPKKTFPVPKKLRKAEYWEILNEVIDPEIGIGIVDLGLIYSVDITKNGVAQILMTLTTPACPVGPYIIRQVEDAMKNLKNVKKVYVEIVWDPVWSYEMIDPDIRNTMF